ncbi:serine O-acetyltransferase [Bacillus sp. ISL-55]|uniref:serine O-acetyltransferase n=1 Tax=Bacillus sp. ISL-55 TaxID=2819134 RepID=UPI001BE89DA5|nr:serine O-acetyltransferase [Bacillus sp. ISL-55]MBT2694466.1 serine acetyltransferase [Bacillus sp. ISL-55]
MKKNSHEKLSIVMKLYRLERFFYKHHMKFFAIIVWRIIHILFSCYIPYTVELGKGVNIAHAIGIVIHQKSKVGANTVIYQNVTLGGRNGKAAPIIGENCTIGAGACILGDIRIGNNVNVGANAVVLKDVPDNCTVVGVPARVI